MDKQVKPVKYNTQEEIETLRALLNRAEQGESVIRIDDTDNDLYQNKMDPRKYVLRRLKLNHSKKDIIDGLKANYEIEYNAADNLIGKCRAELNKQYKEYAANVCQKNIEMLQQLADECIELGQRKTAIEAIKELNKICHLYDENNVTINNTTIQADTVEISFK